MQNWKDLYIELAEQLSDKIPAIKYFDLWHNQVNFLSEEHHFPSPALFFDFRIIEAKDSGNMVQTVKLQVDTYLFYETFADTYKGSHNQSTAVQFLEILNEVYGHLHAKSGNNYSEMRHNALQSIDTGGAGNTYRIGFECTLQDYAAQNIYIDGTVSDVDIIPGDSPDLVDEMPIFILPVNQ